MNAVAPREILSEPAESPAPAETLRRAIQLQKSGGLRADFLGWSDGLLRTLSESLDGPSPASEEAIWNIARREDPLCISLAGGEDRVALSDPVWFTRLVEPPRRIRWPDHGGPWEFSLDGLTAGTLLKATVQTSSVDLSDLAERIAREPEVYWQAKSADGAGTVRGYFSVMPERASQAVGNKALRLLGARIGVERDLALADCLAEAELHQAALTVLGGLEERRDRLPPEERFLVLRASAAVYKRVYEQLHGERGLGAPEGEWAVRMTRRLIEAAYRVLNVRRPPASIA